MVITVFFFLVLFVQLSKTIVYSRRIWTVIALVIYLLITFGDFYWLYSVCCTAFHPSDPSHYYYDVIGLDFSEVLGIESSNTFYFIINWCYWAVWEDPYVSAFLLKINNVLVYLCAYLLLTKKKESVCNIDYLLLFNPYTLMTLVRNVRDAYIVLFVVVIFIGMGIIKGNKLNLFWIFIAVLLLSITRLVLFLPLLIVYFELKKKCFSIYWRYTIYISVFILLIFYHSTLIRVVGNQIVSAIVDVGEAPYLYLPLLSGELSFFLLKNLIVRLTIGFISFIFTPHPVNFISSWVSTMDQNGMSGMYTGTDNALIAIGSIFNYLFVVPFIILCALNYKKCNKHFLIFVVGFIVLYVISYLGVSDIRNRNTTIFFILSSIMFADEKLNLERKHYLITFGFFCCIMLVSASELI